MNHDVFSKCFMAKKFLRISEWELWKVKCAILNISSRKFTSNEKMTEKGRLYAQGLYSCFLLCFFIFANKIPVSKIFSIDFEVDHAKKASVFPIVQCVSNCLSPF